MSEHISTEISLSVGEVPNSPGFKVSGRLGLGTTNSANIRTTFREKTNTDLEDMTFNIVIKAKSAEGAEDIRTVVQRSIDNFASDEEQQGPGLRRLKKLVAASDDVSFEGEPKFTFTVTAHESNVIVKARPVAEMREMISAQVEMVTGLAGNILEKDQEVYAEFDMGKAFSDLVQSQNWLLDVFDSLLFKIWIHLHPTLFADLSNLATNLGAPDVVLMGLGTAALFHSAALNFNFRSSSDLPEDFKQSLGKLSARAGDPNFHKEIPEKVKKFFGHFANSSSGNLHIFVAHANLAFFIDLHLPGVAKFFSE